MFVSCSFLMFVHDIHNLLCPLQCIVWESMISLLFVILLRLADIQPCFSIIKLFFPFVIIKHFVGRYLLFFNLSVYLDGARNQIQGCSHAEHVGTAPSVFFIYDPYGYFESYFNELYSFAIIICIDALIVSHLVGENALFKLDCPLPLFSFLLSFFFFWWCLESSPGFMQICPLLTWALILGAFLYFLIHDPDLFGTRFGMSLVFLQKLWFLLVSNDVSNKDTAARTCQETQIGRIVFWCPQPFFETWFCQVIKLIRQDLNLQSSCFLASQSAGLQAYAIGLVLYLF